MVHKITDAAVLLHVKGLYTVNAWQIKCINKSGGNVRNTVYCIVRNRCPKACNFSKRGIY